MNRKTIKSKSRRSRRRRREQRTITLVAVFASLCAFALIALILLLNSSSKTDDADAWLPKETVSAETPASFEAQPAAEVSVTPEPSPEAVLPTPEPQRQITPEPEETAVSTPGPTSEPTPEPTSEPTPEPTTEPTAEPTPEPTAKPTPKAALETPIPEFSMPSLDAETPRRSVTVTIAGDCTLGGDYNSDNHKRFDDCVDEKGYDYFLGGVKSVFEQDDLTLVNLEGPLTTSTDKRENRQFNFKGDLDYVKILTSASVEAAGVANNHARDFGMEGLKETARVLEDGGVGCCGFTQAYRAEINGVRICCLSVTEWDYTTSELADMLSAERDSCDALIVMIHWGEEKEYKATSSQVKYGHALIDAGADLVIGSHSHVVGGLEKYKGKYILYSTGNFCFGGTRSPYDYDCLIFQQTFLEGDGFVDDGGIAIIPCMSSSTREYNDFRPTLLYGEDAKRVFQKMAKYSKVSLDDIRWNSAMDEYLDLLK